jgi:hypothetical protein
MVNKATEVRWAENTSCSRNEIYTQNFSQKSDGKKPLGCSSMEEKIIQKRT